MFDTCVAHGLLPVTSYTVTDGEVESLGGAPIFVSVYTINDENGPLRFRVSKGYELPLFVEQRVPSFQPALLVLHDKERMHYRRGLALSLRNALNEARYRHHFDAW
ncbi:MAG TPA: hypothetical protein PK109_02210 [Candidatus Paceibacterota bacterium]|nr:hypothetical protein [Candidatus Paceibacterota bacterium]